jgi:hypothetical protein
MSREGRLQRGGRSAHPHCRTRNHRHHGYENRGDCRHDVAPGHLDYQGSTTNAVYICSFTYPPTSATIKR